MQPSVKYNLKNNYFKNNKKSRQRTQSGRDCLGMKRSKWWIKGVNLSI